jgi:hypothetical protein
MILGQIFKPPTPCRNQIDTERKGRERSSRSKVHATPKKGARRRNKGKSINEGYYFTLTLVATEWLNHPDTTLL